MQARLLYEKEILEFDPNTRKPHAPPALVKQCVRRNGRLYAPIGTLLDDPNCYHIVLMGQAEAIDEECKERTACTPEELAARLHAGRRLMAGIEKDDYELFDKGAITGYDANGRYVPGPNWNDNLSREAKTPDLNEGL